MKFVGGGGGGRVLKATNGKGHLHSILKHCPTGVQEHGQEHTFLLCVFHCDSEQHHTSAPRPLLNRVKENAAVVFP